MRLTRPSARRGRYQNARRREKMSKALGQPIIIEAHPDVRATMERAGLMPVGAGPEQLAAMLKSDVERLARIAKAAGIRPE